MTTKVLIVNHGPDDVLVSIVRATDVTKDATRQTLVHPTENHTTYVHSADSLLIEEIRK